MTIEHVNMFEWVILAMFLFSSLSIGKTGAFVACNIALSIGLYEWFQTVPSSAASATVTLINFATIVLIIFYGRKDLQQIIQPVILTCFIIIDMFLLAGMVYEKYEIGLFILYGLMFITISWSAWNGVGRFIAGIFSFTRDKILSTYNYFVSASSDNSMGRNLGIEASAKDKIIRQD